MKQVWMMILVLLLGIVTIAAEELPAPVCPEVILDGNPTTGYSWTWTIDGAETIVEVDGGYVPAESADGLAGAGGQYRFILRGVSPGEAVIIFTYARPWETTAPLYTIVYRVRVDEGQKVNILSSSFAW